MTSSTRQPKMSAMDSGDVDASCSVGAYASHFQTRVKHAVDASDSGKIILCTWILSGIIVAFDRFHSHNTGNV